MEPHRALGEVAYQPGDVQLHETGQIRTQSAAGRRSAVPRNPSDVSCLCLCGRGIWNVPYISVCYLIKRSGVVDKKTRPSFISGLLDPDMAFCENMRNAVRWPSAQPVGGVGISLYHCLSLEYTAGPISAICLSNGTPLSTDSGSMYCNDASFVMPLVWRLYASLSKC